MAKELQNGNNTYDSTVAALQLTLASDEILSLPPEEVINRLKTSVQGLSDEQAAERLEAFGPNELAREHKHSAIKEFLAHFKSPLVIILLIAGIISGLFGEVANTGIILTIIFVSVILDYYQESKAEKSAQLLKQAVTTTATVIRDNVKQEIKLPDIVPGDIVYLSAGDITRRDIIKWGYAMDEVGPYAEYQIRQVAFRDGVLSLFGYQSSRDTKECSEAQQAKCRSNNGPFFKEVCEQCKKEKAARQKRQREVVANG